jgi:hypothetical protein
VPRPRYVPKTYHELPTVPFIDAAQAWFWFIRCQQARRDGARFEEAAGGIRRPCDPDDLYRAAVALERRKAIGREHLRVLAAYGLAGRPPDARCREEERPARLWAEALDRLTTVLKAKGIVE